ncbi:hypothetical protein P5673_001154 [Acropora cervicornis]|uniref:Uncharacterized protein n=1 Tax=Acropora cervicornis TaxID=6130 RepID=A0AAD9VGW8_ACRCE|nr:hypothetical protein P5673_001154 [Acropora cervicornis]
MDFDFFVTTHKSTLGDIVLVTIVCFVPLVCFAILCIIGFFWRETIVNTAKGGSKFASTIHFAENLFV